MKKYFRKIKKKLFKVADFYVKSWREPIQEQLVLLEGGQGKNINGNMFAMAREICTNPAWKNLKVLFVVTKETRKAAENRFRFYGYPAETVVRNSKEYCRYLATAKYLMTDNSFPPYFHKRDGQIYLNTWHGTPLKTLGKSEIQNVKSMANIQKNYLMSDYALFPNAFTRDVFMKDYMLENIYGGKVLLCDYPRNSIFLDQEYGKKLKQKLRLEDKQLIAYMPTWRGANRKAEIEVQKQILEGYFTEIDRRLREDQIFYVNLHFLVGDIIDYSQFHHIRPFPKEYETYDFLGLCDMLVTDYSSVFFDYAVTERKVILFPYDLEEYLSERGTYFPLEKLPFPIVRDVDGLIGEINGNNGCGGQSGAMEKFLETYCAYRDRKVPEMIMKLLVHGKAESLRLEDGPDNGKDLVLVYGGTIGSKFLDRRILESLTQLNKDQTSNILLCYSGNLTPTKVELLERLPRGVNSYNIISGYNFSLWKRLLAAVSMRCFSLSGVLGRRLDASYVSEKNRLFYGLRPSRVINYASHPNHLYRILAAFSCPKEAHIQHDNLIGLLTGSRLYRVMCRQLPSLYDQVFDHRKETAYAYWEEEEKQRYYNKEFAIKNIRNSYRNTKDAMCMRSIAVVRTTLPFALDRLQMQIQERLYEGCFHKGIPLGRTRRLVRYSLRVPYEHIPDMKVNNKILAVYTNPDGYGLEMGIVYRAKDKNRGKWYKGPVKFFPETDTSAYFHQSMKNLLYLTVRSTNDTDTKEEQRKLFAAYYLAKLLPKKDLVILYEKNSARYEESASILYEKLMDQGYRNVYFFLDRRYPFYEEIPEKYRANLIPKTSFRHYLYFFRTKTLIGTETMMHAMDVRVDNRYARKKLASRDINYVFLQHGVMYMVSMNSESRSFFKPVKTNGQFRVVTSSKREADHFIKLGHYDPDNLYVCGIPKFDRSVLKETADKIVIMLTWRPWEYNAIRFEFTQTRYYQMICRIFEAVPEELRSKVVILPHPLFYDEVKHVDFPLKPYMDSGSKYDDILKETKLLITDYSSIAYDAFYRGTNVIFYWEEKDECLENYGPSTKLMLNETNAFGDVCYNPKELRSAVRSNYGREQKEEARKNYREIVAFHDGKNTERLISLLKKDKII